MNKFHLLNKAIFLFVFALLTLPLFSGRAAAHSVAQVQTTKFFAPETVQMLKDRATAGHPGFQVGDTINYIVQFTPIENALNSPSGQSNYGVNGYVTDYIPSGTQVIGASIVTKSGANYIDIPPSLPGGIDTGWGGRGQMTFRAPFNVSSYDPSGRCASSPGSPTTTTFTTTPGAPGTWTVPAGVTSITVEAWGGGGAGGGATTDGNSNKKGGGGAGGQYASRTLAVSPGSSYAIVVGTGGTGSNNDGGAGNDSSFGANVVARGGAGGLSFENGGTAGAGSSTGGVGDTTYAGGNGSAGGATATGGAGGGGAGSNGAGGNASGDTRGNGTTVGGGNGAAGRTTEGNGTTGTAAGGGGAGAYAPDNTNHTGGAGARGQVSITYTAPITYTDDCNGRLSELSADTGIFYSTDPRTAQYPALPTRILQGVNGYNILDTNPGTGNGAGQLNPIIGQTQATTHNLWDADQTNAFGSLATDLDGLPAPKSSQTSVVATTLYTGQYGVLGTSPYNAGSPVAGPQTGYQLDNTAQVGPWQRIAYPGSRMGNAANGPAPAAESCTTCVGGFSTSAGRSLSASNPLPAGTNAVRWALGRLTVGEIRFVKISLKLTAPVPSGGLINGSEVFGGDSSDTDEGDDNAWRYHVPSVADNNSNLFVFKEVTGVCTGGAGCTPTASDGSYIPAAAKVRYRLTYLNTGNASQTNVILSDTLPCQTAANPVSNISVTGPITLPATNPPVTAAGNCTTNPDTRQTFSFPAIATLGPAEGGTVTIDVLTNAASGNIVSNTARLRSDQITGTATSGGVTSTANSFVQSAANLNVAKTTSTPTVVAGGTVTYTITVTNNGTAAAGGINVYDFLPTTGGSNDATTRFSYAATSGIVGMTAVVPTTSLPPTLTPYDTDSLSTNRQQVRWNFGAQTLAAGASFTITFTATVGAGVPASAVTYDNSVAVVYTNGPGRSDTINVAPVTITSNLSIDKTITHYFDSGSSTWVPYGNFIPANAKVRYRIDYANNGSTLNNAVLSDQLPCQTAANPVSNIAILGGPIGLPSPNPPTIAAGVCSTGTRQTFTFPSATITAGQIGAITFEVQTTATTGDTVVNSAGLSATGASSVTDEVQTTVQSAPVLTIAKSESVTGAKTGETVSYTLTITNTGTANATAISVYDWLPSGGVALNVATRFSSTGTSSFSGSITGVVPTTVIPPTRTPYNNVPTGSNLNVANTQEIVWNFGAQTLVPGASFTITYSAAIGASIPAGYYSNNARVYYNTTLQAEAQAASMNVANLIADVAVTKSNGSATVPLGGATTYAIVITNNGPDAANNTVVVDPSVTGLNKTAVTCPPALATGGAVCPATLTVAALQGAGLTIPTLPNGGQLTLLVTADVTAIGGSVSNSVTVNLPSGIYEGDWNNNIATDTDIVQTLLLPSLLVVKSSQTYWDPVNGTSSPQPIPGAFVNYTISVTNTGPGTVDDGTTVITDPIPANTELFVGDFDGAGPQSGPILFTDGATASGLSYTFDTLVSTTDNLAFSGNNGVDLYGKNNTAPDSNECDPTVTDIKIPLSGIFSGSSGPNPSFNIQFRVRIK